ncbi:hypothetical protein J2T12_003058 [Paenibacillus anaericanus]|uniref:hypothetical protein n=1 Tax=Paenibacillus anaericanus TaxID=170367 RepID=UPI002782A563|nr:hypothetical protein [Paenibacillus anaericanus]MDQ0089645.1 hypothetical protein [Paenibacillus anaericanus]
MDEKLLVKAMKWKFEGMHLLIEALPNSLGQSVKDAEVTFIKSIHEATGEYLSNAKSEEKNNGLQSVSID